MKILKPRLKDQILYIYLILSLLSTILSTLDQTSRIYISIHNFKILSNEYKDYKMLSYLLYIQYSYSYKKSIRINLEIIKNTCPLLCPQVFFYLYSTNIY